MAQFPEKSNGKPRDLHFINEKNLRREAAEPDGTRYRPEMLIWKKRKAGSLPLHSAFLPLLNYSALAATT
jgi:hypothetical protein